MDTSKKQELLKALEHIRNLTGNLFGIFNRETSRFSDEIRRGMEQKGVQSLDKEVKIQIRAELEKTKENKRLKEEASRLEKRLKKMGQAIGKFNFTDVVEIGNCGVEVIPVAENFLLLRSHSHKELAFCAEDKCQFPNADSPKGKLAVTIKNSDLEIGIRLKGSFKQDQPSMASFFDLCREKGIKALFCDQTGVTKLTRAKKDLQTTDIEIFLASDILKVLEQMKGKCAACHHNCPELFRVR